MKKNLWFVLPLVGVMAGCGHEEVKSVEYYNAHLEEAQHIDAVCNFRLPQEDGEKKPDEADCQHAKKAVNKSLWNGVKNISNSLNDN